MVSKIGSEGDRYLKKLKRMLEDGVTSAEASVLIHEAETGKLSQVEAHYLAGFVDQHADAFTPEAKAKLFAFILSDELNRLAILAPEKGARRPVAQPPITKDSAAARVKWQKREGTLFVGGIGPDDPMQGNVGDCYFISALVAVANTRPDVLQRAIVANGDGTFTVTFHERSVRGLPTREVKLTVDAMIPMRRGKPEYARARNERELWPLIFEKAYAAWKGSFDGIHAGMAANALEALTGGEPSFFFVSTLMNADAVFQKLSMANEEGGALVALSKPEDTGIQGIVADHAYAVLGTVERDGQKLVKLRNPWGEGEPAHNGLPKNDGIFYLPIEQFLQAYSTVETMRIGARA